MIIRGPTLGWGWGDISWIGPDFHNPLFHSLIHCSRGPWFCPLAEHSFSVILSHCKEGIGKYALLGDSAAFFACFLPIEHWGKQEQTLLIQSGGISDVQFFLKNMLDFFFFLRFLEISCNVWNIYINIFPYIFPYKYKYKIFRNFM